MLLEGDFPPDGRVEKEAVSLMELGFEVHIACFNFGARTASENYKGIYLHRMRIHRQVFKKFSLLIHVFPLYELLWIRYIRILMRRFQFYAIHVHDLPLCGLAGKIARKNHIHYVADMHENYPFMLKEGELMRYWLARRVINIPLWLRLEKKWLESADRIIVTCQEMKERLAHRGIDKNKMFIVENTVSKVVPFPTQSKPDPQFITLVYVGIINLHRGVHVALEGFSIIRKSYPNARFWIIGDGKYLPALQTLTLEKKIDGVTFYGYKPRKEADELISRADIGIIPHKKSDHTDNTSPNKIFEYFQFGKPVIVSDCNYLVRVIRETRAGEVFNHSSAESFAGVFESMLKGDLEKYSENARKAVEIDFYWEKTVLNLYALYQSLS